MPLDRRAFLAYFSQAGLATTLFPGVLWAAAEKEPTITKAMVTDAAKVAGLQFTDEQQQMMLDDLNERLDQYKAIHDLHIDNSVAPAVEFNPVLPGMKFDMQKRPMRLSAMNVTQAPRNIEDLAFASVRELAELIRTKKISSVALTEMYLDRLKRFDPVLKFVVNLTEDRARAQ